MRVLFGFMLLLALSVEAADWQILGASEAGKHFVDRDSMQWQADGIAFSVDTRIEQEAHQEWLLTLMVNCAENTFSYLKGKQIVDGKVQTQFDKPRMSESISRGSMPDQLKSEFCGASGKLGWQLVGKSNIASVFYDPASIKQASDGSRFQVDTRVVPFSGQEETFSNLSFNCAEQTFTVLKMSKLKNGKLQQVFDKPQPATPTSRTATLDKLAQQFCGKAAAAAPAAKAEGSKTAATNQVECGKIIGQIKSIEAKVQKEYDSGALKCDQSNAYVQQLRQQDKKAAQYKCPVQSLEHYIQTVKEAACER